MLACWPLARLLQLTRPTQGGFLLAIGCINSVYFAYPVALATFDEEGLAQAILFDLGQTMLTLTRSTRWPHGMAPLHRQRAHRSCACSSRPRSGP